MNATAGDPLARTTWEALGTSVTVQVTDARALADAHDRVQSELAAIDLACSRFRSDSDLSRVNAARGRTVIASPLLVEALELALRAARLTEGDVDPTLGRALALAGYDRDWRELPPPPPPTLNAGRPASITPLARERPTPGAGACSTDTERALRVIARRLDWRAVTIDRRASSVRIPSGMALDLGATAKAWAADRAARTAAHAAGCGVLVSVGGDIATAGASPRQGWLIHVTDDHRSDVSAPGQTISIRGGGLATSSTAVRRWGHDGQAMHHIIDPATGRPAQTTWRTVSVAAASCADANVAATAALVRSTRAEAWLSDLGLPARLVRQDGRVSRVGAWPAEALTQTRAAA